MFKRCHNFTQHQLFNVGLCLSLTDGNQLFILWLIASWKKRTSRIRLAFGSFRQWKSLDVMFPVRTASKSWQDSNRNAMPHTPDNLFAALGSNKSTIYSLKSDFRLLFDFDSSVETDLRWSYCILASSATISILRDLHLEFQRFDVSGPRRYKHDGRCILITTGSCDALRHKCSFDDSTCMAGVDRAVAQSGSNENVA